MNRGEKSGEGFSLCCCWWQLTLIAAAALVPYIWTLGFDFVWDDAHVIVSNPYLKNWRTIPELLLTEDKISFGTGYYRPVTYLSFLFDRTLWGVSPTGFHLTNVMLHAAVAASVYALVRGLAGCDWLAIAAALLFALHPVNAESVSFLAGGRNTLLAALLTCLALICYINARWLLSLVFFALSIGSKELAVLLPVLLICYDRWFADRKRPLIAYTPYVAVLSAYLVLRAYVLGGGGVNLHLAEIGDRLKLLPRLLAGYVSNLVWPVSLRIPYDLEGSESLFMVIAILGTFAGSIYLLRKDRITGFSSLWFIIFLLPALNIIPLGTIVMADRYAYLSAVGGCIILARVLDKYCGRWKHLLLGGCALFWGITAFQASSSWRNNQTLYARMIHDAPQNSIGYYNAGLGLYETGDVREALGYFEKALSAPHKSDPGNLLFMLGLVNWELGEHDRAYRVFESLASQQHNDMVHIVLFARFFETSSGHDKRDLLLMNAGIPLPKYRQRLKELAAKTCLAGELRLASLDPERAERLFRRALLYDDKSLPALLGLGKTAGLRGNSREAVRYFKEAAAADPASPLPFHELSELYNRIGLNEARDKALVRYRELLEASPGK